MIDGTRYVFPPPSRNLERAAYFIAGQAIAALSEDIAVRCAVVANEGREACIDVDEPILPRCGPLYGHNTIKARRIIRALLAGPAAQEADGFGRHCRRFAFSNVTDFAEGAMWRAISLAGRIETDGRSVLPPLWHEVQQYLFSDENWAAVTVVAETLIRGGELSGAEIAEIASSVIRHGQHDSERG